MLPAPQLPIITCHLAQRGIVSIKTINQNELKNILETLYDIGSISAIQVLHHAIAGLADSISHRQGSRLFLVRSSQGCFFLKCYDTSENIASLNREVCLLSWLQRQRFDLAPSVVPTRQFEPISSINDRPAILYEYISQDRHYLWSDTTWTAAECLAAGKTLALFHNTTNQLSTKEIQSWGFDLNKAPNAISQIGTVGIGSVKSSITKWLADSLIKAAAVPAIFTDTAIKSRVFDRSDQLLNTLGEALQNIDKQQAESIIVHGDFHPGNLMFYDRTVKGLIDFENAHLEDPLYDFCYGAIMFCADWHNADIDQARLLPNFQQAYTQGYRDHISIFKFEDRLNCLPDQLTLTACVMIYWLLHTASTPSISLFQHCRRALLFLVNSLELLSISL